MAKTHERVKFRLIHTPCCGTLLCWVNPRLPNNCPECGVQILGKLRTDPTRILITDNDAELTMDDQGAVAHVDVAAVEQSVIRELNNPDGVEMIPLDVAVNVLTGTLVTAKWLTGLGPSTIDLTEEGTAEVRAQCAKRLRDLSKEWVG